MELTEVRINLCGDRGGRLKAFCSLTFDNTFVIRDVKLIDGNEGLFLAMPSRKLCDHCPACHEKNHLRARYCNNCGRRLNEDRYQQSRNGNSMGHANGYGHVHGHASGNGHGNGHGRLKLHVAILQARVDPLHLAGHDVEHGRALVRLDVAHVRAPGNLLGITGFSHVIGNVIRL